MKGRMYLIKQRLLLITIVLTYLLIVFGGYVASSESGMGCGPDWPLCNEKVIPQLSGDTLIEFGHRVIGAVLFFMTVFLFVNIKKGNGHLQEQKAANWMILLLTLQLVMGAVVVFYHLPSIIITVHLLIAMIFIALLIWLWRHESAKSIQNTTIVTHLNMAIVLLFLTIGLGAYIKHEELGLSCGWLECTEQSFFPDTFAQLLQTSHRLLALVSAVYIIFLVFNVFRTNETFLKRRMLLILGVVIIQMAVGVMTILSFLSLSMAVWHLAIGTLLFAMILEVRVICYK
ncbi:heme A synthase [Lentibacillus cibarius]|uniref:Heme A synthase n=1 Tax=Lentibacillus cibarius TaxID=2583219 RepID=A0A549YKW9_9BACI|nr:heme A synthase [Lentibacillus cibarius]